MVDVVVYFYALGAVEEGEGRIKEGGVAWLVVLFFVEYVVGEEFITVVNIDYVFIIECVM